MEIEYRIENGLQIWYYTEGGAEMWHREDGPAFIDAAKYGSTSYYLHDKFYLFEEYCKKLNLSSEDSLALKLKYGAQ